ncbi:MAG: histidine phosphatase family protein [Balneolaceae bacterium]|nr:MAG: histidine phosphatase family protein [Balneolaceae bacterium]
MEHLLVLRHAKSDWSDFGLSDFERPLAPRGLKDAPMMGEMVREMDMVPDKIISSPARRAKETAELFAKGAGFKGDLIFEEHLYGGTAETYRKIISACSGSQTVMLIGHNPVIEEFVGVMCTGHVSTPVRMPTAALACLELTAPAISEIYPGSGMLKWFLIPKMLKKIRGGQGSVS